jgi:hypothetical protein
LPPEEEKAREEEAKRRGKSLRKCWGKGNGDFSGVPAKRATKTRQKIGTKKQMN